MQKQFCFSRKCRNSSASHEAGAFLLLARQELFCFSRGRSFSASREAGAFLLLARQELFCFSRGRELFCFSRGRSFSASHETFKRRISREEFSLSLEK
jgi:hypothetical protein